MGLSFSLITYSLNAENIAEYTGIPLFSLNGLISPEFGVRLSSIIHGNLDNFFLIPAIFYSGLVVTYIRRYYQFTNLDERSRQIKSISLVMIEAPFLATLLFGGVISNLNAMNPNDSLSFAVLLGIGALCIIFCKKYTVEKIEELVESRELRKKQKQNTALPDFDKPDFSQVM